VFIISLLSVIIENHNIKQIRICTIDTYDMYYILASFTKIHSAMRFGSDSIHCYSSCVKYIHAAETVMILNVIILS